MIKQASAGIYSWLPLGKRVLDKMCNIVREEQNRAGAIEILMPTIQSADLWRASPAAMTITARRCCGSRPHDREMLYGPTNEEMVTDDLPRPGVKSYKDLPLNLYHIQWKFRDERRPRFGVMRGREFLMKDAYSFDLALRRCRARLQPDVRRLSADLRAMGLKSIPMRADTGTDRRRPQPRIHHSGGDRREPGVLPSRFRGVRRPRRGHRLLRR
jgi:prolyl-tRNA synthetase